MAQEVYRKDQGEGTATAQAHRGGMTMDHAYGRDQVSGTTEAMVLAAELRLDEYTLTFRGRHGRRSVKMARFERRGNTFVYVRGGVVEA